MNRQKNSKGFPGCIGSKFLLVERAQTFYSGSPFNDVPIRYNLSEFHVIITTLGNITVQDFLFDRFNYDFLFFYFFFQPAAQAPLQLPPPLQPRPLLQPAAEQVRGQGEVHAGRRGEGTHRAQVSGFLRKALLFEEKKRHGKIIFHTFLK